MLVVSYELKPSSSMTGTLYQFRIVGQKSTLRCVEMDEKGRTLGRMVVDQAERDVFGDTGFERWLMTSNSFSRFVVVIPREVAMFLTCLLFSRSTFSLSPKEF